MSDHRNDAVPRSCLHGIRMEDKARKMYLQLYSKKHTALRFSKSGLHIDPDSIYCGANRDGLVTCNCCWDRVLEIKCPFSIAHSVPTAANLKFMGCVEVDGNICLKPGSKYYDQVQWLMVILDFIVCDFFFIYTSKGHVMLTAERDVDRCTVLRQCASEFFSTCVLPKLGDRAEQGSS